MRSMWRSSTALPEVEDGQGPATRHVPERRRPMPYFIVVHFSAGSQLVIPGWNRDFRAASITAWSKRSHPELVSILASLTRPRRSTRSATVVSPRRSPALNRPMKVISVANGGTSHRPGSKATDRLTHTATAFPLFRAGSNRWTCATRSAAWSTVSFPELTATFTSPALPSVSTSICTPVVSATPCSIIPVVRYSCLRACRISPWLTIVGMAESLIGMAESLPAPGAEEHPARRIAVTSVEAASPVLARRSARAATAVPRSPGHVLGIFIVRLAVRPGCRL